METDPIKKLRLLTDEELTKVTGGTTIPTVGGTNGYDEHCVSNPTREICEMNNSCFWWNDGSQFGCITGEEYNYHMQAQDETTRNTYDEHSGLY